MKTNPASVCAFLTLSAVLAVLPAQASEMPTPPKTEAEIRGEAAKAALRELDLEIDRVDQLIDLAPSQAERAAAKARLAVLKDRRTALRKTYVKALYDELRADLRAEADRVGAWAKRTFAGDPGDKAAAEMQTAVTEAKTAAQAAEHRVYAELTTAEAATDIAVYKLRPTDTNKAEAEAGLEAVERTIDDLTKRVAAMPVNVERTTAKQRLLALEARRDELRRDFNKARFDALIDDVKSAWNDLVR